MIFVNAFKNLKHKKITILSLILLIFIGSFTYTIFNTTLDGMDYEYKDYLENQNVEDFSFIPIIDYNKDISLNKINSYLKLDISKSDKKILEKYKFYVENKIKIDYVFTYKVEDILIKYNLINDILKSKIKGFYYEKEPSKMIKENKFITRILLYDKDRKINKPYVVKGRLPKEGEITVLPRFAYLNGLKIGDSYKINKKSYKIVGFSYASSYIYPMISFNTMFFDEKYHNIVFMAKSSYEEFEGIIDNVYVGKFTKGKIKNIYQDGIGYNESTLSRDVRINSLKEEIKSDRALVNVFLDLILGITLFLTVIIVRKSIKDEKVQMGVLKSLGYSSYVIALTYLVYPLISVLFGCLLGYLLGSLFSPILAYFFTNTFNIPLFKVGFNLKYLVNLIVISFGFNILLNPVLLNKIKSFNITLLISTLYHLLK